MDEDEARSRVVELSKKPGSHAVNAVAWGSIELETELSEWLKRLPARHLATVAFYLDLLARQGPRLSWPHVRQLDSKLRKLRFHLDGRAVRIIYWIGPGHRIVLLTVFMKSRMRDQREIGRARMVLKRHQSGGKADEEKPWFEQKRKPEEQPWAEEEQGE
ncbi:MAG TPA: type II toxin-antitoxin system RelE/ParE family toxin [Kineosporiaceae bacterium]|nr:type II toxin-antitoxin system RelE/ParE family toxin [Kineosporiaceae bacterium]